MESITKSKKKIVPEISDLDELVAEIRSIFQEDDIDVDYVQEVMLSYKSNPKDWKKFAHYDRYRYTRNLVDNGNGKYNLMLICWSEGQGSSIHDHPSSHCIMKILSGTLTEVRFAWPDNKEGDESVTANHEMDVIGETDLHLNDVTYMSDNLGLHRMENRSHVLPAVSLHLYVPPYESCRIFDQRTGHATTAKVTFFSENGKRVVRSKENTNPIIEYENN